MRKTLKRNLAYDDRNHLYYVSLYYDGENGRRVRRTRTYPTMEQAEQVMKSLTYAYVGRRLKKRDFRSLWITRISAACKLNGMNYSTFMHGLKTAGIEINRKMLSEMAINDAVAFAALCDIAKKAI